jgi:ElaB/YqjD/DUF883 family membrane-anchored ribosome-binding protein
MEQTLSGSDAVASPYHDSKSTFHKVTGKISEGISELAQRLDSESSRIGDATTGPLSAVAPEIKKYGHLTAEALERSADYVNNLDIDEIKVNTKAAIRRNPGRAVLIAAGAGFLLGALIKRRGI